MLIATQAKSIAGTEKYFDTVLTQGDYYTGQEINGTWNGKAAEILGLEAGSTVTKGQFIALLRAYHPVTGVKLAQRIRKDRRPGIDLTFSVPKSVSLLWAINRDEKILEALREAVKETMSKDVEPLMCRRVRSGKFAATQQREKTGNLLYADFFHTTSRPVDGQVDPHLHIHAFVMNYTHADGKHYAAEPEEIFRERASLQAKFEARLARRLEQVHGYGVEKVQYTQGGRLKAGWELQGISRETIEKFSARTGQIEAYALEHGITEAAAKGKLGVKTREQKDKGVTVGQLRLEWLSRLSAQELKAFEALRSGAIGSEVDEGDASKIDAAVDYALQHHLYRQSTVERHVVVGTALEHGLTLLPEQVEAALDGSQIIQRQQEVRGAQRDYLTTREVLEAESRMIEFARDSRGTRMTIARAEHTFQREWLNDQQKAAVRSVLHSRDTVMAITGGAGAGKTSLTEEAVAAIHAGGKQVFMFAPSTGACEVLQEKGFEQTKTVEHLLRNERLHPELKDQVLWVDEAGLLDVRSMNGIFDIAKQQNARVVLCGDSRQHSSPRRGEALRLLEAEAGLQVARVDEIQRQKGQYKRAVELISQGHSVINNKTGMTGMVAGFDLLDRLGKIQEIAGDERHEVLSDQYFESTQKQKPVLVVAPTHAEGRDVTQQIRERLRKAGAIGREACEVQQLRSLNLSEAEKSQAVTYGASDLVVQFHQNVKGGYQRGQRYRVVHAHQGRAALEPVAGGARKPIPLASPDRFEVYAQSVLELAIGDRIRFSLGGKAIDNKRQISNGRLDEISGFTAAGDLRLKSGLTVSRDYGHLDYGYVVTSHASQGKDRDVAIAALGSQSLGAVNAKQFYVTVSRGREDVAIYVDDKAAVRRAIQNAGEQLSATELVGRSTAAEPESQSRRKQQRQVFWERICQWWRSRSPGQQIEAGLKHSQSSELHHSPDLSRS